MVKNPMSFPALRRRRRSSGASSDPDVPDKRFRAIFNAAPVGIALADAEGRAIESNQSLRDLLGYTVRWSNDEGLTETARWYVEQGWISPPR